MNFKPVYFVKILRKKDSGVGEGRSCFAQMWVRPAAVQSVAEASVRCTQTRVRGRLEQEAGRSRLRRARENENMRQLIRLLQK